MPSILRYPLQAVVYAVIAALIGYFAGGADLMSISRPTRLRSSSLVHGAERREPAISALGGRAGSACAQHAQEGRLSARTPAGLDRDHPTAASSSGRAAADRLSKDGPRGPIAASQSPPASTACLLMRDSARSGGATTSRKDIELKPQQSLAVDFRAEMGGFILM
jgi:hypothetical protein